MRGLATLGDFVDGADWRALTRANDIARRPSPKNLGPGRPDRGYVDQSPPPTPRPPSVIPLATLHAAQEISKQDEPRVSFGPGSALDQLIAKHIEEERQKSEPPPPPAEPPQLSTPEQLAELSMAEEWVSWNDDPEPELETEPGAEEDETETESEPPHDSSPPQYRYGRHQTDEYKAWLVSEFVARRKSDDKLTQRTFAESVGANQSLVSNCLKEAGIVIERAKREVMVVDPGVLAKAVAAGVAHMNNPESTTKLSIIARDSGVSISHLSKLVKEARRKQALQERASKRLATMGLKRREEPAAASKRAPSTPTGTLMSRPAPPSPPPESKVSIDGRIYRTDDEKRRMLASVAGMNTNEAADKLGIGRNQVAAWRRALGSVGQVVRGKGTVSHNGRPLDVITAEFAAAKAEMSALAERLGSLKAEMRAALDEDE